MNTRKGFTLIETLCSIFIIIMISSLCYPQIKPYVTKDRLDVSCEELIADLRYAKMTAICKNKTTVRVLFFNDNGKGEYSEYMIYSDSKAIRKVKLPDNIYISRNKSTFSKIDAENRLIFYSKGNVNPPCKITLIDKETGREKSITLTIGYTRIMKVDK
ncbi:MAG: prepilin-type N-terminal cleavage/methylation domain-containing protein [Caloramator sp.]|nr:prepilin-type N-terminal cleavage/methylation domain-containing protein [Caloramator sp.]